jgi:glycosyltransferase involved in cell wall biosynthesis
VRICIAYDCLYPWTVGGAERWYRHLAERLAADGHEVTYITLRQWDAGAAPAIEGVRVVPVGPRMALYTGDAAGRRRIAPPVVYGLGCLVHLVRHGSDYDVVHLASFPYFSLLAAAAARPLGRYRVVVDWHEVWSGAYWREYLGRVGGGVGHGIQRLCARVRQRAFCFSRLHAARLRAEGLRGEVQVLEGEFVGSLERPDPAPARPQVVFAGRLIPEKRAPAVPPAVRVAREQIPDLTGIVFGDGPDRTAVRRAIADHGLVGLVDAPGFVAREEVDAAMASALCLVLPSSREGYGLVVVEASSLGVPAVVVAGPDNAAVELVQDGVNGVVAASASPADLGAAIARVAEGGEAMRQATADWYAANARRLSLESSLEAVLDSYRADSARR